MAELVGDDAGHLLAGDLAAEELAIEAAGDEDAPVRGGEAVHRVDLVDEDRDLRQVERAGQPVGQPLERGIGQPGGAAVKLAMGPPDRDPVEHQGIENRQQDGRESQHDPDMGIRAGRGKMDRAWGAGFADVPAGTGGEGGEKVEGGGNGHAVLGSECERRPESCRSMRSV